MAQVFKVRKSERELVKPAKPTPGEVKPLSDWDDRVFLRFRVPCIMFYSSTSLAASKASDPAETIKKALAEALVLYYPMAGRIRELQGPGKRLVVDCNAEGVEFVSAEADVTLDQLGPLHPPFRFMSELLPDPHSSATLGCPIFVMQVTRLLCGGVIVAFGFNHVMCDVAGAVQFVTAISELARGAHSPSVVPGWQRELLNARVSDTESAPPPPHPPHHRPPTLVPISRSGGNVGDMTYRSFFFRTRELEAIRAHMGPQCPNDSFTSFDLISGCAFHCKVVSLEHAPDQDLQLYASFSLNARSKFVETPIPPGYYGNASFLADIIRPMQSFQDLRYVVEQVNKAKSNFSEESARLSIQQEVMARRSGITSFIRPNYSITHLSRAGLSCIDFGWGKPVYAEVVDDDRKAHIISHIIVSTNDKGEQGRFITHCMPKHAMDKFDSTLRSLIGST